MQPDLCLIGEAPGADEDREGEPFVGAAGKLLNKILAACGLERNEVYICNILKCRPPGNRAPLPHESANCREYLNAQLALGPAAFHLRFGRHSRSKPARHHGFHRPHERQVLRVQRHPGFLHVSSGLLVALAGKEARRLGGYADIDARDGQDDSEPAAA